MKKLSILLCILALPLAGAQAKSTEFDIPQVSQKPINPETVGEGEKSLSLDGANQVRSGRPEVLNQPISEFGRATTLIEQGSGRNAATPVIDGDAKEEEGDAKGKEKKNKETPEVKGESGDMYLKEAEKNPAAPKGKNNYKVSIKPKKSPKSSEYELQQ
jgi:hypothetical protein